MFAYGRAYLPVCSMEENSLEGMMIDTDDAPPSTFEIHITRVAAELLRPVTNVWAHKSNLNLNISWPDLTNKPHSPAA